MFFAAVIRGIFTPNKSDEVDRAGITAFRDMTSLQAARQLIIIVSRMRPERRRLVAAFADLDWWRIDVTAIVTFGGLATIDERPHSACRDWLWRRREFIANVASFSNRHKGRLCPDPRVCRSNPWASGRLLKCGVR